MHITLDNADIVILKLDHVGIVHGGVQCLRPVVLVRLRVAACIPATVTEAAAVAVAAKARIEILLLGVGVPEEIL